VDDRRQRVAGVDGVKQRGQLSRVAGVAGGDGDFGAQTGQTLLQIARPGSVRTSARHQQQLLDAVAVTRCSAKIAPSIPVPPVISTVPSGSHTAGGISTIFPVWRAWLISRNACGAFSRP